MWVQSAGKKVSFCLIILARLAADTLSASMACAALRSRHLCRIFPLIGERTTFRSKGAWRL